MRRWLRFTGIALATLVAGGALLAAVWIGSNALSARADAQSRAYAARHASALVPGQSWPLSDAFLRDHRLFLLGEVHGIAAGQTLDLDLLRVLHRSAGVRYYVGEFDMAQAERLNRYLQDGDERNLHALTDAWYAERAQWASEEFLAKWRAIRHWNQTLPQDERIEVLGADRTQNLAQLCDYLGRLLDQAEAWQDAPTLRAALAQPTACADNAPRSPLTKAALQTLSSLSGPAPEGMTGLAWRDLGLTVAMLADRHQLEERERVIAANMKRMLEHPALDRGSFYGLWGIFHVIQVPVSGTAPAARLLRDAGHAVGSIAIFTLDGQMMLPRGAWPLPAEGDQDYVRVAYSIDDPVWSVLQGVDALAAAAPGEHTLIRLDGEGSPVGQDGQFIRFRGLMSVLQPFNMDYRMGEPIGPIQYIVVSRGSPATRPARPER